MASLPMFVCAGCMAMCLAGFNAPQRIGAYIRTFIEGRHPGFNWEEALRTTYLGGKITARLAFGNRPYMIAGYVLIFTSFGVASCSLTIAYGPAWYAWPVSLIGISLVLISDVVLVYVPLRVMRRAWATRFETVYRQMFGEEPWLRRTDRVTPPGLGQMAARAKTPPTLPG